MTAPGGKIILVSGPSGSGKGALIDYVRTLFPDIVLSVSCTTRAMRPGEEDGKQYHFLSKEEFERRIDAGEFLEWAQYGGNFYGTPASGVLPLAEAGKTVLIELEIQGVRQLREKVPANMLATIFIDAGPWDGLAKRILARAPIMPEELAKREARFNDEAAYAHEAMYVIQNHDGKLEEAKRQFANLILSLRRGEG